MSMAFKCDRCKGYFDADKVTYKKSKTIAGLYKYNSDGNWRDLDICPKCYSSLVKWMEKGGAKSDKEVH